MTRSSSGSRCRTAGRSERSTADGRLTTIGRRRHRYRSPRLPGDSSTWPTATGSTGSTHSVPVYATSPTWKCHRPPRVPSATGGQPYRDLKLARPRVAVGAGRVATEPPRRTEDRRRGDRDPHRRAGPPRRRDRPASGPLPAARLGPAAHQPPSRCLAKNFGTHMRHASVINSYISSSSILSTHAHTH